LKKSVPNKKEKKNYKIITKEDSLVEETSKVKERLLDSGYHEIRTLVLMLLNRLEKVLKNNHDEKQAPVLLDLKFSAAQLQEIINKLETNAAIENPQIAQQNSFIAKVGHLIELHMGDNEFGVNALARKLAMSVSQMRRKINSCTGQSPLHYIRSLRLNRTKTLLKNTELSASEIAYKCGFSTPSYFSRVFFQETGQTPCTYRKIVDK
jgi:AraC-like DNA-binding protein